MYSSYVPWITGQAMEKVHILIDTWEGHLTPSEVASIADRASRGWDRKIIRAAAELALSCLQQAHALNPCQVQRALFQCKEQSSAMLEEACLAVESAAKGKGVYPEVLFIVAGRLYDLSEEACKQTRPDNQQRNGSESRPQSTPTVPEAPSESLVRAGSTSPATAQTLPSLTQIFSHNRQLGTQAVVLPVAIPSMPNPSPDHHPIPHQQMFVQPTYNIVPQFKQFVTPYSQSIPMHAQNIDPYVAKFKYNSPMQCYNFPSSAYSSGTHTYNSPMQFNNIPQSAYSSGTHYYQLAQGQQVQVTPSQDGLIPSFLGIPPQQTLLPLLQQPNEEELHLHTSGTNPILNPSQEHYLNAAFRGVGILALETLARRVHDYRPQTKFARNPPMGDEVRWLLSISMKLGTSYLQQFTASVVSAVVSPFLLYDIAIESAQLLAKDNPEAIQSHLESGILNPLVKGCLQMFIHCFHQRIRHMNTSEYDDFVSIICSARNVFFITPEGMVQFQKLLQSLQQTKYWRKDLWQRIMNGLATPVEGYEGCVQ